MPTDVVGVRVFAVAAALLAVPTACEAGLMVYTGATVENLRYTDDWFAGCGIDAIDDADSSEAVPTQGQTLPTASHDSDEQELAAARGQSSSMSGGSVQAQRVLNFSILDSLPISTTGLLKLRLFEQDMVVGSVFTSFKMFRPPRIK